MIGQGRQLGWKLDPLAALARFPSAQPALLLHSGRQHQRWARHSLLATPRGVYRFLAHQNHGHAGGGARRGFPLGQSVWVGDDPLGLAARFRHDPWEDLRLLLGVTQEQGIWIGYLSYDLGRWVEHLPQHAADDRQWPIIELAWCPGYLLYDLEQGSWQACAAWREGGFPDLAAAAPAGAPWQAGPPRSVFSPADYQQAVARVKSYIAAGDVFQVNLAQRFTAELSGQYPLSQRSLFARLAQVSPAWYGAYLELGALPGGGTRAIASTSPELFLEVTSQRVVTRPIKGTRPASCPAAELRDSSKDAAELHMIVDLMRNDLGRVCAYNSVQVMQPREIETHPTVHHGVATIHGQLHQSKTVVDLLRATMPGGSITGAPKVRAMEIIDELEPVRRGPYCGAIGYLSGEASCLNIAIRTMLLEAGPGNAGRVDFSVGGGIVADSDEAAEYQETLDKAAAIMTALG